MISMARIDDRLIHGQVAVKWSKELGISRIIVASDSIAKNAVKDMKILLVSNDPRDILAVFKGIEERPVLNVANYGRINGPIAGKQKVSDSVYLTDGDRAVLHEISDMGVEIIHQPVPENDRKDLMSLI